MPEVTEKDIQKWYKAHEAEFINCPYPRPHRIRKTACETRQIPRRRFGSTGEIEPLECQKCPMRNENMDKKPAASKGNRYSGDAGDKRWLARAQERGYKSEEEMWRVMEKDFTTASAAKIWGVKQTTILYRWNKFGIKHSPGGPNHCLLVVAICSKCKTPLECLGTLWKMNCGCSKQKK